MEPIFNPKAAATAPRRHEWVRLYAGRVCVQEMTAADTLFVLERAQRLGAGHGISGTEIMLWQVVVSCYDGPGPEAKRIFEITDLAVVQGLRNSDWQRLQQAIERVNMLEDAEVAALEDFTAAAGGNSPGG